MSNPDAIETGLPGALTTRRSVQRLRLSEDWTAVVIGFVIIATVLAAFHWKLYDLRGLVSSYRWTTDSQIAASTPGWINTLDAIADEARVKGQANVAQASQATKEALQGGDRRAIENAAGGLASFGSRTLPGALGAEIRGHAQATADTKIFTNANLTKIVAVAVVVFIVSAAGFALIGGQVSAFLLGLPMVFGLAWLARFLAGNGLFIDWGIEYVIFALGLGLLISNTVGTPEWLKPAVQTEFFIKTGLVIL